MFFLRRYFQVVNHQFLAQSIEQELVVKNQRELEITVTITFPMFSHKRNSLDLKTHSPLVI